MKKIFFTALASFVLLQLYPFSDPLSAQPYPCDTVRNYTDSDTLMVYINSGGGYVSGHNSYGDVAKAEKFSHPFGAQRSLSTIFILFGHATSSGMGSTFNVVVWAADGAGGAPGTVLHTQPVTYSSVVADIAAGQHTVINLVSPLTIPVDFFIGVEFTYAAGDTIAIATTTGNTATSSTAWDLWDTGAWYTYDDPGSWVLNLSHAIRFLLEPLCEDLVVTSTTTPSNGSNGAVSLNTVCGTQPLQYSWSTGATTRNLTALAPGTYNVTVSDANGCSVFHAAVVDDHVNVYELDWSNSIKVFPTQTNGILTIDASVYLNDASVEVKNVVGKTILKDNFSSASTKIIDISGFSNGIYFVSVKKEGKTLTTSKIVLNK